MARFEYMPSDPVTVQVVEQVMATSLADEIADEILRSSDTGSEAQAVRWRRPHRARRSLLVAAVGVIVALAVALPLIGRSSVTTSSTTTPFRAGRIFRPSATRSGQAEPSGRWQLVTALSVITGSWQQNTEGPPPGSLTCTSGGICFVLAGEYSSAKGGAPLLGASLYVTGDLGLQWQVIPIPLPSGFQLSTPLNCPSASVCAFAGFVKSESLLFVTNDGGHEWAMTHLGGGSGALLRLVCFSATACDGIVGPNASASRPTPLPNESFVVTNDAGAHWTSHPLPAKDIATSVSCPDVEDCFIGSFENVSDGISPPSFVLVTTDGGDSWSDEPLPAGFSLEDSALTCFDDLHCVALGTIPVPFTNPPQCGSSLIPPPAPSRSSFPLGSLSPSVSAVSLYEGLIATEAAAQNPHGGTICSNGTILVSDIAVTSDGGSSWTPVDLPSDVPEPQLNDVSCESATVCWVSGSEAVPVTIANAVDAGSSMLLGTTDGGQTWSKVTFTVPTGAPNAYGQEYLSIGSISCTSKDACLAHGFGAQSSSTAPIYSLVSGSGT